MFICTIFIFCILSTKVQFILRGLTKCIRISLYFSQDRHINLALNRYDDLYIIRFSKGRIFYFKAPVYTRTVYSNLAESLHECVMQLKTNQFIVKVDTTYLLLKCMNSITKKKQLIIFCHCPIA